MSITAAILCLLFGIFMIIYTYKNPNKREFSEGILSPDFQGYGSGFGLIVIGIAEIIHYFS
jgi:hypothetical protein